MARHYGIAATTDPQLARFQDPERPGLLVVAIVDALREHKRLHAAELTRLIFAEDAAGLPKTPARYSAVVRTLGKMRNSGDVTRQKLHHVAIWELTQVKEDGQ